jgi:tetratricopeptide (TPR) repeat protein
MNPDLLADRYRFAELEYQTLRREIEDAKGRMFKIIAGEAILFPSIQVFLELKGKTEASPIFYLMLPFLIFVFVSRFLYENNSTIRAGCYIRSYIEPIYIDQAIPQKFLGWEEWLEIERELAGSEGRFKRILNVMLHTARKLWSYLAEIKTFVLHPKGSPNEPKKSGKPHRLVESYLKEGFYWLSAFYYLTSLWFIYSKFIEFGFFYYLIFLVYILLGLYLISIISDVWITTSPRLPDRSELENINILNKAIDLCPRDPYLRNTKGEMYIKIGLDDVDLQKIREAIDCFDKAIGLNPYYPEAWYNKGLALKALGKSEVADAAFYRSKELDYKG